MFDLKPRGQINSSVQRRKKNTQLCKIKALKCTTGLIFQIKKNQSEKENYKLNSVTN